MRGISPSRARIEPAEGVRQAGMESDGWLSTVVLHLDPRVWTQERMIAAGLLVEHPRCPATKTFTNIINRSDVMELRCDAREGHSGMHTDPESQASWR